MQTLPLYKTRLALLFVCLALVVSACASDSTEEPLSEADSALNLTNPIPAALAVPKGNHLAFVLLGRGVQIYKCQPGADTTTYAWTFVEPDAKLIGLFGLAGHHYVGPTWEANDGSTVVGTKLQAASVDATAIPWLLLQGTSHTGTGRMSAVTYVQRLFTKGGLAPTTGCDAVHAGTTADIEYTATYAFYR